MTEFQFCIGLSEGGGVTLPRPSPQLILFKIPGDNEVDDPSWVALRAFSWTVQDVGVKVRFTF
jgi:hypothetical protein